MAKSKVSFIELVVGGKKIRLSIEEAQELHQSLDALFGKTIQYIQTYRKPYWEWTWTYPDWSYSGTTSTGTVTTPLFSYNSGNETVTL
jgi:hypothetical protein